MLAGHIPHAFSNSPARLSGGIAHRPGAWCRALHLILVLLCPLLTVPAHADTAVPPSKLAQLATDPQWLALVHYHRDLITGQLRSQADDTRFFLSPNGKQDPGAELAATLKGIRQTTGGDSAVRCRFPARDHWLRQRLGLPQQPLDCPALQAWLHDLNTRQVTLVFAASYLNSPSSMFGHTFLRLDPPSRNGKTDLLLASTISYAADAGARDNELMFAYRGIFGGYPGVTAVEPYYKKVKQYSDLENRDLWEYRLNLKRAEVRQLLLHAWELKDMSFDYYFFDENCAYRILALLDVARPGVDLTGRVTTHAIPSDTVRWVLDAGLVDDVHYRPSSATVVAHELHELTPESRRRTAALARGELAPDAPAMQALPMGEAGAELDAAYDYVQYMAVEEDWPREVVAPRSYALLQARSRIEAPPPDPVPTPEVRDDQGHETFRASLSAGREDHENMVQFTLRPAYHDLLDAPEGYRNGAQLQFLRLDGRYYPANGRVRLQQLTGVEIRSLSPRDRFFKPLSWQVGFGARRQWVENGKDILTPYLDGGAGFAWSPASNWLALTMGTADLEIDNDLNKGAHLAPGVDAMLLYQSPILSVKTGIKSKLWLDGEDENREDSLYGALDWHLTRNLGLFAVSERTHYLERYHTLWRIGVHRYF